MNTWGPRDLIDKVRALSSDLRTHSPPPEETAPSHEQPVVFIALVAGTRGYLEKISHQVNGTYEHGWYDACAVMIRRLVETLIIEVFEAHKLEEKIKNKDGDFVYLGDLINAVLAENSWTLSRNSKKSLKALKDIGDKSAHSRRFVACRRDIDNVVSDLRVVIQELIFLAGMK